MKRIFLVLILLNLLSAHAYKYRYNYCNKDIYTIYYESLTSDPFIGTDRKMVLGLKPFKIPSCKIKKLFKEVLSQEGKGMKPLKYLDYDVKVIIKDSKNNEIIITKNREVISLLKYRIYSINKKTLDDAIDEITKVGEAIIGYYRN